MKNQLTRFLHPYLLTIALSLTSTSLVLTPIAQAMPPRPHFDLDETDIAEFFEDAESSNETIANLDASAERSCTDSIEKYARISRNRALIIPAITVVAAPVGTFITAGMGAQIAKLAVPNGDGWAALGGVIMGLLVGIAGSAISFSIVETKAIIQAVQATKIRRLLHAATLVDGQQATTSARFDQRSLRTFYRFLEKSNENRLPNEILSERDLALRILTLNSTGALCDGSLKKKAPRERHVRKNILRKLVVTPKELLTAPDSV